MKKTLFAIFICVLFSCISQHDIIVVERSEEDFLRAGQVADLKFGMFICWSFSTFSGQEWTPTLDKDASYFKATGVDTDQWCRAAKDAGMNYILFLTKHHDGFCLWDTDTTDKKVTNSSLGVDVLAELRKSCDKYNLKLALYFSEGDWNWPGAADGKGYHQGSGVNPELKKAQLEELCTRYGDIEFFWMDYAAGDGGLSHTETTDWVHAFQPQTFVGYNHGEPSGRLVLRERGKAGPIGQGNLNWVKDQSLNEQIYSGYMTAEFTYPILPAHRGGADWFYSLPQHDNLAHPASKIYQDYLQAVKHKNIFSLNVGPGYDGCLRDIDVARLKEVGKLIRNGESYTSFGPVPNKNQLEWQAMEYFSLICFGLNSYSEQEWGYGNLSPELFNPSDLDTDQWASVCKNAGMKGIILVAKHHDGFCLWQTETTDYSVASSPWKDGQGDVVDDLYNSCRKFGLKFGIYISPWDRNHPEYGRQKYVEVYHRQWQELLERYGENIFEVWFDGANGGDGWYGGADETRSIPEGYYQYEKLFDMIHQLAPNAVIFNGFDDNSIRWVGNERGYADSTNWSLFNPVEFEKNKKYCREQGMKDAEFWMPAEADTPLLKNHHWYHHSGEAPKSLPTLTDIWYKSIGRNAVLNLGLAIDKKGQIKQQDVEAMLQLRDFIDSDFSQEIIPEYVSSDSVLGVNSFSENLLDADVKTLWASADSSASIVFQFSGRKKINRIILQEPVHLGQRIEFFTIEKKNILGKWQKVSEYTTVGYKRILRFFPFSTDSVRITINSKAPYIALSTVKFYNAPKYNEKNKFSSNNDSSSLKIVKSKNWLLSFNSGKDFIKVPDCFDSNEKTLFKSDSDGIYSVYIDIGKKADISGFYYLPVQGEDSSGIIYQYRISVLDSNFKELYDISGRFSNILNSRAAQNVFFNKKITGRYLKIELIKNAAEDTFFSCSEMGIY